jgi:hypothetical protein
MERLPWLQRSAVVAKAPRSVVVPKSVVAPRSVVEESAARQRARKQKKPAIAGFFLSMITQCE